MKLPSINTNLGRVLRAMYIGGHMTAGEVRRKAGLHPDTAVTARIRDLRKIGCEVFHYSLTHATDPRKQIHKYWLRKVPFAMSQALKAEMSRRIAA